jgi:hypothetical protein
MRTTAAETGQEVEGIRMVNGKACPACGKDIGIWAVVAAGLPSRIRCPHCRTLLRYDGALALMALPFVIVIGSALIIHEVAVDVGIASPGLLIVVLVIVTWVPVELLLAIYLRENRTLRVVHSKRVPPRGA